MATESVLRRLAFIKFLFNQGTSQVEWPEPQCASSILLFHDSMELFLQLSSETLNISKTANDFMSYWDAIGSKVALTQKESSRRLNKARVSLKHHGTLPSKMDLKEFSTVAKLFFEENSKTVFGVEFKRISLIEMVESVEAKISLQEAQEQMDNNNFPQALCSCATAYSQIMYDYIKSNRNDWGGSPFQFGPSLSFLGSFSLGIKDDKISKFVDATKESIEEMQDAMRVMCFGIDYRRHLKFKRLTPIVQRMMAGNIILQHRPNYKNVATKDEAQFCFDFVIESALKVQEFHLK